MISAVARWPEHAPALTARLSDEGLTTSSCAARRQRRSPIISPDDLSPAGETVICKLPFALAEPIRKIGFLQLPKRDCLSPRQDNNNEMSRRGLSQDRNYVNETNSPFSPGLHEFRGRASSLADANAESETLFEQE
jgi:hypothetical protein